MGFVEAIQSGFRNYVNFSTRSPRSAFWYWQLFNLIAGIMTLLLDSAIFGFGESTPLNVIYTLATILPSLAVGVRRLHDIDRSGWWLLLILIPLIGIIMLIIWWCQASDPRPNRFGPDPLGSL